MDSENEKDKLELSESICSGDNSFNPSRNKSSQDSLINAPKKDETDFHNHFTIKTIKSVKNQTTIQSNDDSKNDPQGPDTKTAMYSSSSSLLSLMQATSSLNKSIPTIELKEIKESTPQVSSTESIESTASARPTKSYMPFPVSKSSLNRKQSFWAVDMRPVTPLSNRMGPFLGSNSGISLLSPVGSNARVTLSPMQSEYPLIAHYLRKSSDNVINSKDERILSSSDEDSSESIFRICGQKRPIPMNLIFTGLEKVEKVGEGVFGEVYLGYFIGSGNETMRVYKVVAIEGKELVNGERQKTFSEIIPEVIISQQVSKLHTGVNKNSTDGYVKMHNARITVGKYPQNLIDAWVTWNKRYESDNDCPNFKIDQLYVIFEYDHGGKDVEPFLFESARQSFSLVLQVAHILAVGESAFEMEHRDLHWGNLLVAVTNSTELTYQLNGKKITMPSQGVKACIIDFTLARIKGENGLPVYLNLDNDEEQFLGTGDHQFDIYRMMKDFNRNDWGAYFPKSNLFWIHYLAEKVLNRGRYKEVEPDIHTFFMKQLRHLNRRIMEYSSCTEFVFSPLGEQYRNASVEEFMISRQSKMGNGIRKNN